MGSSSKRRVGSINKALRKRSIIYYKKKIEQQSVQTFFDEYENRGFNGSKNNLQPLSILLLFPVHSFYVQCNYSSQ